VLSIKKMNGAELPCGSQLRVEPSQSNNATKKNASSSIYGPAKTTVASLEDEPTEARNTSESSDFTSLDAPKETKEDSPDEDLDDFFSSL
jgi:hypothetical protein